MQLWTGLILGLAGSLHCAGMCGPLALALATEAPGGKNFVLGRLSYNAGRLITYTILGLIFGLLGQSLAMAGLQRWVSIGLGVAILLYLFVSPIAGWIDRGIGGIRFVRSVFGRLLRRASISSLLIVGMMNGLLPCGLVYVACAGAAATGGLLNGAQYMLAFGVGTVPMMLSIALLGRPLQASIRWRFQKLVPISVGLVAILLVLRGLSLGIPYISPELAGTGSVPCH